MIVVHVTLFGKQTNSARNKYFVHGRAAFRILLKGGGGKIAVSAYQGSKRYILYIYSKISRGENIQQGGGGGGMPPHPPKKNLHGTLSKDVASKCEADPVLYLLSCAL